MTAGPQDPSGGGRPGRDSLPDGTRMHGTSRDNSTFNQVSGGQYNIHLPQVLPLPVTCTLPADTAAFTGRSTELSEITAAVAEPGRVVAIHAIDGMPGVGKTALAVRAGYLIADRFPDLQLFMDMKGHTPGQQPTAPADALASMLAADGVDTRYLPSDLDGRAAMWRDRMAGKRALLILDNAASSDQVAPLLPGAAGCLVLVTSRRYLGDLPQAAVSVPLDILPADEAAQMFLSLAPHAASAPAKVAELVALSGHLPLAILLLARLFTKHRSWSMDVLIGETTAKLLTVTAESRTIAAAFDLSYQCLGTAQQRFFRHLGLHPGAGISPHAAAALTGLPLDEAAVQLDRLHSDRLLAEPICHRYRMHDLIREYARDLAATGDSAEDRQQAVRRLLDYYLHTAFASERRINPGRDPIILATAQPGVQAQQFTGDDEAWQWLTTEHANLLAAIKYAVRQGLDAHAWQLPWAMATFLDRRGHWQDLLSTHQTALAAAGRADDQAAQASTHRLLSHAYLLLRQPTSAFAHLEQAVVIWRELGDRVGLATAHHGFSLACEKQGDPTRAITHAQQALDLYRAADHHTGEANALNTLGANYLQLNDYQRAVDNCREALNLFCTLGDRVGQASALESLGDIAYHDGHPGHAIANYQRSVILRRELSDHYLEAVALIRLGDIHHSCRSQAAAAEAWQHALTILDELVHPDAPPVRAKLAKFANNSYP